MIDIVEVKDAIRRGRLSIQVKNNALLMKDKTDPYQHCKASG